MVLYLWSETRLGRTPDSQYSDQEIVSSNQMNTTPNKQTNNNQSQDKLVHLLRIGGTWKPNKIRVVRNGITCETLSVISPAATFSCDTVYRTHYVMSQTCTSTQTCEHFKHGESPQKQGAHMSCSTVIELSLTSMHINLQQNICILINQSIKV